MALRLHKCLHQSLRKGCNAACMWNLSFYFPMKGQSGIYEYIPMCKNLHVLTQKLDNKHIPRGSWPLDWTQRQVLHSGSMSVLQYLLGQITRHFIPDVTVCISDGTFALRFESYKTKRFRILVSVSALFRHVQNHVTKAAGVHVYTGGDDDLPSNQVIGIRWTLQCPAYNFSTFLCYNLELNWTSLGHKSSQNQPVVLKDRNQYSSRDLNL